MLTLYTSHNELNNRIVRNIIALCKTTSDVSKADYLLLPFGYENALESELFWTSKFGLNREIVLQNAQIAEDYDQLSVNTGKALVVFYYSDSTHDLLLRNAIVFRVSGRKSLNGQRVYGMPAFLDFLPGNESITIRSKQTKPRVSFRGQAAPRKLSYRTIIRYEAYRLTRRLGLNLNIRLYWLPAYLLRRQALMMLEKQSNLIDVDVKIIANPGDQDYANRSNYIQSIQDHDYILCVAGWGNFSYRFYETMRDARIPVFINTDCLMPCEDKIDYKSLLVWVEEMEVNKLVDRIIGFHNRLSTEEFQQRQWQMREVYLRYFTYEGFAQYVIGKLLAIAN